MQQKVTAWIRTAAKEWEVHKVGNLEGNITPKGISDLHSQIKADFPNSTPFILIQNV